MRVISVILVISEMRIILVMWLDNISNAGNFSKIGNISNPGNFRNAVIISNMDYFSNICNIRPCVLFFTT